MSLNEDRVAAHRRLIEAEQLLYGVLERRGLTGADLDAAFEAMQTAGGAATREEDIYLSTLSGYVTALGGQLDLLAVFPEATVHLLGAQTGSDAPRAAR